MSKIKIKDLPEDQKISQAEMKKVLGGSTEMDALQLQMTMDRRSKIIQTLSNILKKTSQTQDSIIQNLK